jgi:hypothetical protein
MKRGTAPKFSEKSAPLRILGDHGFDVSGVRVMFSADNDLSGNRPIQRQAALDYLRREIAFAAEVKGSYPAMKRKCAKRILDQLVQQAARYFREREESHQGYQ